MSEPPREGRPVQAFIGGALMVVGGLLGGLSGLCTVVFMVGSLFEGGGLKDWISFTALALAVGFLPIVIGLGLFIAGRYLYRGAQPAPRPVPPPADFGGAPPDA
jgi:hypothetical protein